MWFKAVCITLLPLSCCFAADLSPSGVWQTIDDHSGKPRGVVRIYEDHGQFIGKVEGIVDPAERKLRCVPCKGERKDQPILGLIILRGLREHDGEFTGGDILDPENGNVYRCKIRVLEGGRKLMVRGFIGISLFGRSQYWIRQ